MMENARKKIHEGENRETLLTCLSFSPESFWLYNIELAGLLTSPFYWNLPVFQQWYLSNNFRTRKVFTATGIVQEFHLASLLTPERTGDQIGDKDKGKKSEQTKKPSDGWPLNYLGMVTINLYDTRPLSYGKYRARKK